jgi:hypothetical protein
VHGDLSVRWRIGTVPYCELLFEETAVLCFSVTVRRQWCGLQPAGRGQGEPHDQDMVLDAIRQGSSRFHALGHGNPNLEQVLVSET